MHRLIGWSIIGVAVVSALVFSQILRHHSSVSWWEQRQVVGVVADVQSDSHGQSQVVLCVEGQQVNVAQNNPRLNDSLLKAVTIGAPVIISYNAQMVGSINGQDTSDVEPRAIRLIAVATGALN